MEGVFALKKSFLLVILLLTVLSSLPLVASAHSGKTDANGGHWDHSIGEYHYHHGKPAHYHKNGICPYEVNDTFDERDNGKNESNTNKKENDTMTPGTIIGMLLGPLIACGIWWYVAKKKNSRKQQIAAITTFLSVECVFLFGALISLIIFAVAAIAWHVAKKSLSKGKKDEEAEKSEEDTE